MHKIRNKYFLAGFTIIVVLIGLFAIAPTLFGSGAASPGEGGNVLIGDWSPGGGMPTFVDNASKAPYSFRLIASEEEEPGDAKVTLYLDGPSLTLCSAHGSPAILNIPGEDIGVPYDYDYSGNYPLADIQCGTAYAMAVSIDGCQADIQFHGYIHSDYPLVTYMGMMTTDVSINIASDPEDNLIEITVFTPKETIKLKKKFEGDIEMDTCPYIEQGE